MNSLFPELDLADALTLDACHSTARSWCDPSQHQEVVGIDFGRNAVHYYMARCKRHGKMKFGDLRPWLLRLPTQTLVVCEWAHLAVPQTSRSLAQPFKAKQLLELYAELRLHEVTLKLAPHAHSGTRMRLWVSGRYPLLIKHAKKSDASDALALAVFVNECNEISLANPPKTFLASPCRKFGRKVTERSNVVLNAERTDSYRGRFFPLLMKLSRKVSKKHGGKKNEGLSAAVVSTLACEQDGKLYLFTHRGQVPGRWFWMRDVLRMSAWHHQGGIARSNLMWHRFRPFAVRFCRNRNVFIKTGGTCKKVALMSDKEKDAWKQAMRQFREMLLTARETCLKLADEMGAGRMELSDVNQEAKDGR